MLGACEQSSRKDRILTKVSEGLNHQMDVLLESKDKKNDYNWEKTENCLDTFQIDPNET